MGVLCIFEFYLVRAHCGVKALYIKVSEKQQKRYCPIYDIQHIKRSIGLDKISRYDRKVAI